MSNTWWSDVSGFLDKFKQKQQQQFPTPNQPVQQQPPPTPQEQGLQQQSIDPNQSPEQAPLKPVTPAEHMSVLEDAGRRRLLALMLYNGEWRYIEPYSYRRKSTGLLLMAFCHRHQHIEAFKPDKIQGLELTDVAFKPRWPVEIGL